MLWRTQSPCLLPQHIHEHIHHEAEDSSLSSLSVVMASTASADESVIVPETIFDPGGMGCEVFRMVISEFEGVVCVLISVDFSNRDVCRLLLLIDAGSVSTYVGFHTHMVLFILRHWMYHLECFAMKYSASDVCASRLKVLLQY
jgi:hypothetical protein